MSETGGLSNRGRRSVTRSGARARLMHRVTNSERRGTSVFRPAALRRSQRPGQSPLSASPDSRRAAPLSASRTVAAPLSAPRTVAAPLSAPRTVAALSVPGQSPLSASPDSRRAALSVPGQSLRHSQRPRTVAAPLSAPPDSHRAQLAATSGTSVTGSDDQSPPRRPPSASAPCELRAQTRRQSGCPCGGLCLGHTKVGLNPA